MSQMGGCIFDISDRIRSDEDKAVRTDDLTYRHSWNNVTWLSLRGYPPAFPAKVQLYEKNNEHQQHWQSREYEDCQSDVTTCHKVGHVVRQSSVGHRHSGHSILGMAQLAPRTKRRLPASHAASRSIRITGWFDCCIWYRFGCVKRVWRSGCLVS